ncbi:hypothetical protein EPH_0029890 [Eimeria praecox]|uniref:Uncharacterized protein n=1 Tax=Eimeria praecox TaxID=51316 RepID=U6G1D2_9EIME|nr:hypothetical protein EPH_0029890 [Eimeria praecox]
MSEAMAIWVEHRVALSGFTVCGGISGGWFTDIDVVLHNIRAFELGYLDGHRVALSGFRVCGGTYGGCFTGVDVMLHSIRAFECVYGYLDGAQRCAFIVHEMRRDVWWVVHRRYALRRVWLSMWCSAALEHFERGNGYLDGAQRRVFRIQGMWLDIWCTGVDLALHSIRAFECEDGYCVSGWILVWSTALRFEASGYVAGHAVAFHSRIRAFEYGDGYWGGLQPCGLSAQVDVVLHSIGAYEYGGGYWDGLQRCVSRFQVDVMLHSIRAFGCEYGYLDGHSVAFSGFRKVRKAAVYVDSDWIRYRYGKGRMSSGILEHPSQSTKLPTMLDSAC